MAAKVTLCAILFTSLAAGVPTPRQQAYKATGVQNLDASADVGEGEFLDIAVALMPQIEYLVQNLTAGVTPADFKDINRVTDILLLFVPFMKKTLEFEAEDEGRTITAVELETIDNVEIALSYISQLILNQADGSAPSGVDIPDYNDLIPDYTDLLSDIPDFNIPSVVIPERRIPDVVIPEINIPGGSNIPRRKIALQSIPEVNIPGRKVPVTRRPISRRPITQSRTTRPKTSRPITHRPRTTRPKTSRPITHRPRTTRPKTTNANEITKPPTTPSRVSPSSVLRDSMVSAGFSSPIFATAEPKESLVPFRDALHRIANRDVPILYHNLPGGGFFYRAHH